MFEGPKGPIENVLKNSTPFISVVVPIISKLNSLSLPGALLKNIAAVITSSWFYYKASIGIVG